LQEGCDEGNYFVSPCACSGSIQDVHVACLRHWVNARLTLPESANSFLYTPPECELCKKSLPASMEDNESGLQQALVDLPGIEPPFVVLESMDRNTVKREQRSAFHVVSLANARMAKIGRADDCDVRVASSCVSRWHATLTFGFSEVTGHYAFFLEDHDSKFGSCVAARSCSSLEVNEPVILHAGNTVIGLTLKPAFNPVIGRHDSRWPIARN